MTKRKNILSLFVAIVMMISFFIPMNVSAQEVISFVPEAQNYKYNNELQKQTNRRLLSRNQHYKMQSGIRELFQQEQQIWIIILIHMAKK